MLFKKKKYCYFISYIAQGGSFGSCEVVRDDKIDTFEQITIVKDCLEKELPVCKNGCVITSFILMRMASLNTKQTKMVLIYFLCFS